ncbi:MAG: hypothetical protein OHK0026_06130 [Rhodocyclaceae bacterium]
MKAPMMLPWLARRAGVPLDRAQELWAEALRHARLHAGRAGSSEYWRAATTHLLERLAEEGAAARIRPCSAIIDFQVRFWLLSLAIWRQTSLSASRRWIRLLGTAG